MWHVSDSARVFLALGATDMRKAANGLAFLVEHELGGALFSGDLFAFCNRARDLVKILYWSRNGLCLWSKRLEKDRKRLVCRGWLGGLRAKGWEELRHFFVGLRGR